MVNMRDDGPAVVEQSAHERLADPLSASGDDCCASLYHEFPLSLRAKRSNPGAYGLLRHFVPRKDGRMPERHPPIEAHGQNLADLAAAIEARGDAPPVDRWNPQHCGHSGMLIARN